MSCKKNDDKPTIYISNMKFHKMYLFETSDGLFVVPFFVFDAPLVSASLFPGTLVSWGEKIRASPQGAVLIYR